MDKELKRRLIRHLEAVCRHYVHIIMQNDRATTAADALSDAKQLIAYLKSEQDWLDDSNITHIKGDNA